MFENNPEQLKAFLVWCKSQRIKKVMLASGDSFEFSELAFIDEAQLIQEPTKEMLSNEKTLADTFQPTKKEIEEDLYWSAQ